MYALSRQYPRLHRLNQVMVQLQLTRVRQLVLQPAQLKQSNRVFDSHTW